MTWQLFILAQIILTSGAALMRRRSALYKPAARAPLAVSTVVYVVSYLVALLFVPWLGQVDLALAWANLPAIAGAAGLFGASGVCAYMTFVYLDGRTATLVSASSVLVTMVLAWLLLGETLSLAQGLGSGILLASLCYAFNLTRRRSRTSNDWNKGLFFGGLAALASGLGLIIERLAVAAVPVATYVTFSWGLQALLLVIALLFVPRQLRALRDRRILVPGVQVGTLAAVGGLCFIMAQAYSDSVGTVAMAANFRIVLVTLLAGWLLGERLDFRRHVAVACAALVGLSVILW